NWQAHVDGDHFVHAPQNRSKPTETDQSRSHTEKYILYKTPYGENWRATWIDGQFEHSKEGSTQSHTADIIDYVNWQGKGVRGQLVATLSETFTHSPIRNSSPKAPTPFIQYKGWDSANWQASIEGDHFVHAPQNRSKPTEADQSRSHTEKYANYKTPYGENWRATWVNGKFEHSKQGSSQSHTADIIDYVDWKGNGYRGHFNVSIKYDFLNILIENLPKTETAKAIKYKTWNGSKWQAHLDGDHFVHAPQSATNPAEADLKRSHTEKYVNYKRSNGENWTATWDGQQFKHQQKGTSEHHFSTAIDFMGWDDSSNYGQLIAEDKS
ncbi:MAG: hypothetical protein AAGD96_24110, partial [Chloroflexota bacterium]